ncbi:MAG TPA: hypothetical protein VFR67_02555 [Pilimelia sp.]|nr:hypothetical protein [Pilimelia sp.]
MPETGRAGGAWMRMRAALALSALVLVLMAVASATGLVADGLYRDPAPVASMLRGYDPVTLVVAVPALGLALLGVRRGSVAAQLVWVGMLAYAGYTYAIYVFGTAFNNLFLAHVAVFSGSVYALTLALSALDVAGIARRFNPRTPARWIAGLLALLALGLGGMWVFYSLRFAATGDAPVGSVLVETPTIVHLGYALDLSLLVPAYALAAVLLWRRAAWGYVLAAAVLVSGTVHQVGYLVALPFQVDAGVAGASAFDPGEPPIAVAFLIATVVLLAGLRRPSPGARPRRAALVPDR